MPTLFIALQSTTNVQFGDHKLQVSYLAKYAAGIEKQGVALSQDPAGTTTLQAEVNPYLHTKISGWAIKASQHRQNLLTRGIALTEMIWFCAGLPYVSCDIETTNVSTMPPESRAAILRGKRNPVQIDGVGGLPQPADARRGLPVWRQFSDNQILAIQRGSYYLDVMTSFSLRPPELRLVDNVELYAKYFTFSCQGARRTVLHDDLSLSPWVDGANRQVRMRHAHVSAATQLIIDLQQNADGAIAAQAHDLSDAILLPVQNEHLTNDDMTLLLPLYHRFLDTGKMKRNVVTFTQVTPTQFPRFLIHLMLSMGHFETEIDLYSSPSMIKAFRRASLIGPDNPTDADVQRIVKQYVVDQLQWLAVGTKQFSRLLQCSLEGLSWFLTQQDIAHDSLPLYLERDMVRQATLDVEQLELERRSVAVDALFYALHEAIPNFPDVHSLKEKVITDFVPQIFPLPQQLHASVKEQSSALMDCQRAIDNLFVANATFIKWPLLVGPPGSGKTHILLLAQTYALPRGLNAQLVAMTSERASRLGGEHIHLLLGLPVLQESPHTISALAEKTLFHLRRSPIRMAALQRIDLLFIEEVDLVSSETLAVMDVVLRHIRENPVSMGGVLIVACGDPRQLTPVSGSPIWTSFHLITSFRVHSLQHYVRAQHDANLQIQLQLLWKSSLTDQDLNTFEAIIRQNCIPTACVPTWDAVPGHILRVVGTRKASKSILDNFLNSKRLDPTVQCFTSDATDEIEASGGQVLPANSWTTNQLNYKCLEPASLLLFVGAVMRLTYNNTTPTHEVPRFSQGQLCIVSNIDTHVKGDHVNQIMIKLVPPGVRNFDVGYLPEDWPTFPVKVRSSPPLFLTVRRTKAWPKLFPLCHFVCSTIHKAIGETLPQIATQVSLHQKEYRLWEREQLLVLLSRVHTLQDITFVSHDHYDAIVALMDLVQQPSRLAAHIDHVLRTLDCGSAGPRIIHHQLHLQPTGQLIVPATDIGFVYLLVSTTKCRFAYVGETASIRRRLREHNSDHGSQFTQDPSLRPWALLALVSGFHGDGNSASNVHEHKAFERAWHLRNGRLPNADVRGFIEF